MLTAARWLLDELRLPLLQLDAAGYRLLLTGHSLGAGVATLLTALVRQIIPTARCFGYATPPVVSGAALLAHIEDYCISVVHRNDVIPRTTIRTCTQVVCDLASYNDWKADAHEDWQGVKDRAKLLWVPQVRQPPSQPPPRLGGNTSNGAAHGGAEGNTLLLHGPASGSADDASKAAGSSGGGGGRDALRARVRLVVPSATVGSTTVDICVLPASERTVRVRTRVAALAVRLQVVLEVVGEAAAIVPPPSGAPRGEGATTSELAATAMEADAQTLTTALYASAAEEAAAADAAEAAAETAAQELADAAALEQSALDRQERIDTAVLAELEAAATAQGSFAFEYDPAAPMLRVPGRILKFYMVHGVYRACWIPSEHQSLCEIALTPHMVSDHTVKAHLVAFKSAKAAMLPNVLPPAEWVPFDVAPPACACCGSAFSWESTCKSEAQQICARHHCRSCGRVVCDPCSRNRAVQPQFGIVEPSRVCDACFFKA